MPRGQLLERRAVGLVTHPSEQILPEGALLEAKNAVIDREGVVSSIAGFNRYVIPAIPGGAGTPSAAASDPGEEILSLHEFQNRLVAASATTTRRQYDADWLDHGPSGTGFSGEPRARSSDFGSFLLITDASGVFRITDGGASNKYDDYAGIQHPPQIVRQSFSTSGGVIANAKSVSYRATIERRLLGTDSDGIAHVRDVVSAASPAFLYTQLDHASPVAPTLRVYLPEYDSNPFKDYTLKLWRTTVADSTETGDSHLLVKEQDFSGLMVYIDITDDIIDDFLGQGLYQNPEFEGETNGNDRPPYARDICQWKGHTFYAVETRREHVMASRLVALPADTETLIIRRGSTLLPVDAETFTAKTTPAASADFGIITAGTAQENLRDTARNLCQAINRTSTIYSAEYVSGINDPAGQILIRARDYLDLPIEFADSSTMGAGDFEPAIDSGKAFFSTENQSDTNAFYYSKLEEPEAVPYFNRFRLPDRSAKVLRLIPTGDALFIFTDRGIWTLTGDTQRDWVLDDHDLSVRLVAPDTAVVMNDAAWAYTNQGVIRATSSGVEIVSRAIERTLDAAERLSGFSYRAFAVADEETRRYWLWVPNSGSGEGAEHAYVHNYLTRAWTGPITQPAYHAISLREGGGFYVSQPHVATTTSHQLLKQRDTGGVDDFSGLDFDCAVRVTGTAIDADGLLVSVIRIHWYNPGWSPTVGWRFQHGGRAGHLTAVQDNGDNSWTITLDTYISSFTPSGTSTNPGIGNIFGLMLGGISHFGALVPATLTAAMPMRVRWAPEFAGDPSKRKQFSECQVSIAEDSARSHRLGFSSDYLTDEEFVEIELDSGSGWGEFYWGDVPWGGVSSPVALRTYLPQSKQLGRQCSVIYEQNRARSKVEILSVALTARLISERTRV